MNGTVLIVNRPFLLKLDSNFVVQWANTLPVTSYSTNTDEAKTMVVVDSTIYVAGMTYSAIIGCPDTFTGTSAGFMATYDTNGTLLKSVLLGKSGISRILKKISKLRIGTNPKNILGSHGIPFHSWVLKC